jgi:DNA modification methylase
MYPTRVTQLELIPSVVTSITKEYKVATTATPNYNLAFFDWYLMPEAFSASLVGEAIQKYGIQPGQTVLDPFSGTGTTPLAAKLKGINGVGIEVNPFLCFASKIKLKWDYNFPELEKDVEQLLRSAKVKFATGSLDSDHIKPNMPRIDKWITPKVTNKVLAIKSLIVEMDNPDHRNFCLLALAANLREVSNMKLSPQAFGSSKHKEDAPVFELFQKKLEKMLSDLTMTQNSPSPTGMVDIIEGDNRCLDVSNHPLLPADLAVTSPPYLNNLDYTMQTRMELFFLDFVENMLDLRSIRKSMVICDAKAMYKDIKDHELIRNVESVQKVIQALRRVHQDKNWGWDYAFMSAQYFGGILRMLLNTIKMLKPGARFVIVTGESAHSGVLVPVPAITAELGQMAGFEIEDIVVHRTRRTSSHNYELKECSVILQRR